MWVRDIAPSILKWGLSLGKILSWSPAMAIVYKQLLCLIVQWGNHMVDGRGLMLGRVHLQHVVQGMFFTRSPNFYKNPKGLFFLATSVHSLSFSHPLIQTPDGLFGFLPIWKTLSGKWNKIQCGVISHPITKLKTLCSVEIKFKTFRTFWT